MYNTVIIGAGPTGSYLALKLAELGHKVIVLEKKANVCQDIFCTGIIGKECYDLLALNNSFPSRQANEATFFFPSNRHLRIWRDDEVAYIVDRPSLNRALANQAQAKGVEYFLSTQATKFESNNNCIQITANRNSEKQIFETETVVIATGYGSNLPANLNLGKIADFTIGAQAEVQTIDINEVEIYLDQNLAPGGFAWLVPTIDGKGLAGLMTRLQPEMYLNKFLAYLKTQNKIISTEVISNYEAIPLRPLPKTYADRILVVGEAAGQVKPITGGGIYYGLICADIAANIIHQAFISGNFTAAYLSLYQKQWRAKLGKELTAGYRARRLWAKLGNKRIEHLYNIARKKHIPELITTTEHFSFDWHNQLFLQLAHSLSPFAKHKKQL